MKLLIVMGYGGHTRQMLRLAKLIKDKYGSRYIFDFITNKEDKLWKEAGKYGRVFRIINPRSMKDKRLWKVLVKFIPSSLQVLFLLPRTKARAVICCGTALSLNVSWLAKYFFRKKIIFLESWSRVKSMSEAARFMKRFADLFIVQWPQQLTKYKNAVYAGRLG